MVAAVQLPLASPSGTPLSLDPKLFRPGSLLQALVVGKTAEGLTQLQIGDLLVVARLPQMVVPGTTLQLAVKSGGAVPELVLTQAAPPMVSSPAAQPVVPAALPISAGIMPQVEVPAPSLIPMTNMGGAAQSFPPVAANATSASIPLLLSGSLPSRQSELGGGPQAPAASPAPMPPASLSRSVVASAPIEVSAATPLPSPTPGVPSTAAVPPAQSVIAGSASPQPVQPASTAQSNQSPDAAMSAPRETIPAPVRAAILPSLTTTAFRAPTTAIPTPPQSPPLPQSPKAALAQMVPAALAQQGSPAPVLQALAAVAASAMPLPAPVLRAAQQVLATRILAPLLSGDVLKAAVEQSGVLMEAVLATGSPPSVADTKAGLLALRSALVAWLGDLAPVDPVRRVPPPIKGETPRAQLADPAPQLPSAPHEAGRVLHGHTEGALSRLKLMQLASLPDAEGGRSGPELRLELPLQVGSELAMMQLQIFRDGKREREAAKRGWRMRFAVATTATGEVGAEVGLVGKAVTVALWAAEQATADALGEAVPELNESLSNLGLSSSIRLRRGPPHGNVSLPGTFVDRGL